MVSRSNALNDAPSAGTAPHRFSAISAALLGLALLFMSPALGAAQTPSEVPDDVFRAQLEAELLVTPDATLGALQLRDCPAILAGPNRARALAGGDCTEDSLDAGLVTITPEPGTMALIAIPAVLMMLGVGRRRRTHLSN